MSPLAKKKAAKAVSDAAALRWVDRWYRAYAGERFVGPRWSQCARAVDELLEGLEAAREAMRNPLAPGAGRVISETFAGELLGGNNPVSDADVTCYGDAFDWVSGGAPQDVLEKLRHERLEREARHEADRKRQSTPEAITASTLSSVDHFADTVVKLAIDPEYLGGQRRALTYDERVAVLQKMTKAMLGYSVCFDYDAKELGPYELPQATKPKRKVRR